MTADSITAPRLMIAAPSSGCGKSVIASGLMTAYSKLFLVQGFKVGPDYIDPMYHTAATRRPSRNLDTWMLSQAEVKKSFFRAAQGASLNIIEGVMGLFDGYGADPFEGSSAGVAELLQTPIILVIDCAKMSASASALVHGFHTFSASLPLAGVICNRVGSQQHAKWLVEAIEKWNNLPVLGCIPHLETLNIPERYLGLLTVRERETEVQAFLARAGEIIAQNIDLDRLLVIARQAPDLMSAPNPAFFPTPKVRVAVARDEAFCFYYEDNLDELRQWGAEIVFFSPLRDAHLPGDIGGIYLGGGYPELYAETISSNQTLLKNIAQYGRLDMPIFAECGGLLYLAQTFRDTNGSYPMVGLLPGWCEMGDRLNMGYREVETIRPTLLGEPGTVLRGHEFHYSRWENPDPDQFAYHLLPRSGDDSAPFEGYAHNNLQASYIHLHFAQNPLCAQNFVQKCLAWKAKEGY
jgi:cobyrinic acid a,c-diamide synthase